ncbi:phosphoribosylformylglycinamidine synthase subunit PurL [Opitutales bacterium]|uniref:phosphoribosylformylglycinamidine synthase subunit PurL n=1 Tax=Candidatus Chordibacter forsetii TaxID=3381758 RepID=UPI0031BF9BFB|nr:phosphoribosylformylglycinamidine synthase subunit PurL [Opitutales bacterium]
METTAAPLPPNPDPCLNVEITPELVAQHGLLPEEYERILGILGRTPNLTELGIFSVMWSEHCAYKNTRKLLKLFPTEKKDKDAIGQVLVKAGDENAGVIDVGEGWGVAFKIESHNHPSAIEPFEGAATGVGGIVRDIFTMGARPVLLTNSLRFGSLESSQVKRLFRGVVSGISHYGNCLGIPNMGGDVYFDDCYEGNPLVNALCAGILRHEEIQKGAATGVGNPVYYVGPGTGRDGLGGASFASRELTEESAEDRPAVQKGDPFMEKLLLEACLEMMSIPGLVVGIQDMGAAGLTCSTCETASRGDSGIEIDLDLVPQRETGMNSYEIMLSESQERMLVIVAKGRERELEEVFEKWDLHAAHIGEVKEGNRMVVRQKGVVVADLPAKSLTDEAPIYDQPATEPAHLAMAREWKVDSIPELGQEAVEGALLGLLTHPTIASKRWIWKQYDHMVMSGCTVEPGSDAGVVKLSIAGINKYLAIANDCNNRFCYLDPYRGAQIAFVECMRNLACSGARALAVTDNLNFGNPNKPEAYHMLKECVKGLADACAHFDVPVVGGNVSLYNEHGEGAIDPTPVVSMVGLIDHPDRVTRSGVKDSGLELILLGGLPDELGGSYYLQSAFNKKEGTCPKVDLDAEMNLQNLLIGQIEEGRICAAHDLSEGGLLVCLAEMLFDAHGVGASISLPDLGSSGRLDALLFGESQARAIIAVKPEKCDAVIQAAINLGVSAHEMGKTDDSSQLKVEVAGTSVINADVSGLKNAWESAIPKHMEIA